MSERQIALALGGGGARGIAHIPMLEALDELGVKPVALAGTSMGAIYAAAYASGLSGKEIHAITLAALKDRRTLLGRLLEARAGSLADLFQGFGNPLLIDAEKLVSLLLPEAVALTFMECSVPLTVCATDYYARSEAAFTRGDLRKAVAASIAIPGLFRPVEVEGRVLVDGGAVNPLPYDHVMAPGRIVIAIDVTGGPARKRSRDPLPGPWDAMFGTLQILQHKINQEKIALHPPEILIRPDVDLFKALDFLQASVIMRVAAPAKDELKRKIEALLSPHTSSQALYPA